MKKRPNENRLAKGKKKAKANKGRQTAFYRANLVFGCVSVYGSEDRSKGSLVPHETVGTPAVTGTPSFLSLPSPVCFRYT